MLKTPEPAAKPDESLPPPSALTLWLCASGGVWVMYLLVFLQVPGNSFVDAAINALANVAPLALLAAAAHWMIKRHLMQLSVVAQIIGHVAAGAAFAVIWFTLVTLVLALIRKAAGGPLDLTGFTGGAFVWQALQLGRSSHDLCRPWWPVSCARHDRQRRAARTLPDAHRR